jgi:hypothetical protein
MADMDVSRAQLSDLGDQVLLEDPGFPFRVRVILDGQSERPAVQSLAVESVGRAAITSATLSQIPVRQIAGVAASMQRGDGDEARFRALAQPRPEGERSWPPEHFERVNRVAAWARSIGRDGGGAGTVAEFWRVNPRTARRWLAGQQ